MTFISYPNISAVSDNGEYRIEIVGTSVDDFFRDQGRFVYRLFKSNSQIWDWPTDDPTRIADFPYDYPHEAWVSDDGWVVIRTHEWFHAGLFVLSPDGQVAFKQIHRKILEDEESGFLDSEPESYMGDSSAGPFWARSAFAYFAKLENQPFWILRTWWGHRVVIDLKKGRGSESPPDLLSALRFELAYVQNSLFTSIKRLEEEGRQLDEKADRRDFWSLGSRVLTSAYHAGWLNAIDTVPLLRRLEKIDLAGGTGYGPIDWASVVYLPFRQVAKLSLLRLNENPRWLASFRFQRSIRSEDDGGEETREELMEFPDRAEIRNPSLLQLGLNQRELLGTAGAPEVIENNHWEYDFLDDESCLTARVYWDSSHLDGLPYDELKETAEKNPPRIERIEILEPQWKQITSRDRDIIV